MTGYFSPDARQSLTARGRGLTAALRFGPTMVSLSALIWAAPALAQTTSTTVSSNTTTALSTSAAGDITINSGDSIKPASGAAVTINSNNSVTNNGIIQFQNIDGAIGILAKGGFAGGINNNGTIDIDETVTATTDNNGIVHGPFATGTNRFGIQVIGPGPFTGSIDNSGAAAITVRGNNSAGISVETDLVGDILHAGSINVAGTNTYGIHTTGSVSGNVTVGGTLSVQGQGAQGVNLGGDVSGAVVFNGTLSTSGYRFTTRSTDTTFLGRLTADDLLQSLAAVTIGGSVGHGVLVDSTTTTDATSGVATTVAGQISSTASAPALVVGSSTRSSTITLGNVGTDVDAYGLEIKGDVGAAGIYDNVSATGVQLGVAGGGTIDTTGGIRVAGTISASAYAASATALHLAGTIAPIIRNEGTISAVMNSDAAGASASAIFVEAGSSLTTLQNGGIIAAGVAGQLGNAAAIVDRSGTLAEVENIGTITATRTLTNTTSAVTGTNVALDLSRNTSGVHILQSAPGGDTETPAILGSVTTGSGGDRLEILAGSVIGDINLGAGANSLTVDNAAVVRGGLDANGGTVALTVGTGTLQISDASQLKSTGLSLGSAANLIVTADPSLGRATSIDVAGTASIANGATIGVRLASVLPGTATYTLIHATQLTDASSDTSLLGSTPFLYTTSLQSNAAAGTITATLTRKTAAQLGLPTNVASAYEPLIAALGKDTGLEGALLIQDNRAGLITLYNQLLPNHSGALFNTLASSVEAFGRPLDERQDPVGGGFWMQEANAGLFANGHTDDPGYKAWSFGLVAGYETPRTPLGILGATFGASTNEIYADAVDDAENLHANLFDAGVYWRIAKGGFAASARIAADYVQVSSTRVIEVLGGDGLAVSRSAGGNWNAVGFNARVAASYETRFGNVYFRPLVNVDYIRMAEGGYTEGGGGDVLDTTVASRTSSRFSGFAGVAVGALYGPDRTWGPEALIGYKGVANEVLGVTTARFVGGSDPFTLRSDEISGQGAAVHLSLKGENGSGGFALSTGAEARDGLNIYDLRVSGHVQF